MFKIYDLNMKEITLPKGVMPLEIFVGSVAKERTVDTVDGRAGVVDYGFNYTDRPVSLFLRIKATDKIDFRLLRNEVFATFDVGSAFYVAESDVPSRVLKVVVDESYVPDRLTEEYADFDINCRTLDSVFWESKYSALELHDTGYSATAEKYGLVDNIDDEKVKYRFEGALYNENLMSAPYDYRIPKGVNYEEIHRGLPAGKYTISFDYEIHEVGVSLTGFLLYAGERIVTIPRTSKNADYTKMTFDITSETANETFFLYAGTNSGYSTENDASFKKIKIESGDQATPFDGPSTKFSVYNAGNVTIEPEYMDLTILVLRANFSESLTIRNVTTSEEFTYYGNASSQSILLDGINVLFSSAWNRFRNTNRRFIRLAPGDNLFEVTGGTFEEISFDFKYLYR